MAIGRPAYRRSRLSETKEETEFTMAKLAGDGNVLLGNGKLPLESSEHSGLSLSTVEALEIMASKRQKILEVMEEQLALQVALGETSKVRSLHTSRDTLQAKKALAKLEEYVQPTDPERAGNNKVIDLDQLRKAIQEKKKKKF